MPVDGNVINRGRNVIKQRHIGREKSKSEEVASN